MTAAIALITCAIQMGLFLQSVVTDAIIMQSSITMMPLLVGDEVLD